MGVESEGEDQVYVRKPVLAQLACVDLAGGAIVRL